jgi:hypothetical protein
VADATMRQFGPEDGTSGLPGEMKNADPWSAFKALVKMVLMTGLQATQGAAIAAAQGAIGGHGGTAIQIPDSTEVLADQLEQVFETKRGDEKRYLHVPASTACYVVNRSKVWPEFRHIAGMPDEDAAEGAPAVTDSLDRMMQMEEKILKQAENQQPPTAQPQPSAPRTRNEAKTVKYTFDPQ